MRFCTHALRAVILAVAAAGAISAGGCLLAAAGAGAGAGYVAGHEAAKDNPPQQY
jgi:hypothetical protein